LALSPKAFNERTGIVIGLPMTTAAFNETNPFAVKFAGPRRKAGYILGRQPKSFDWRVRHAKPHPWKQIPAAQRFVELDDAEHSGRRSCAKVSCA